eukprot:11266204-Alexandrium_andersonii.AAC.1
MNDLKNFCYSIRAGIADDTLRDYCEVRNKEQIEKAAQDTLDWLEDQSAEKNEYEAKQLELKGVVNRELKR